eukprot:443118_1
MSTKYTTAFYIQTSLWSAVVLITAIFFLIQVFVIKNKFKTIKSISKTFISSSIVHLSFCLCGSVSLFHHLYWWDCKCPYSGQFITLFYDIGKWNMWYFFVGRAELAQGIIPVLPISLFKKYVPFVLISSFIGVFIMQVIFMDIVCPSDISNNIISYCLWIDIPIWLLIIGLLFEVNNSFVFTSLFIIPLWKLNKHQMNHNTKVSKSQFKKELIWNISCTFLATLSTAIFFFGIVFYGLDYWWAWQSVDVMINSTSCFLMIKPNTTFIGRKLGLSIELHAAETIATQTKDSANNNSSTIQPSSPTTQIDSKDSANNNSSTIQPSSPTTQIDSKDS